MDVCEALDIARDGVGYVTGAVHSEVTCVLAAEVDRQQAVIEQLRLENNKLQTENGHLEADLRECRELSSDEECEELLRRSLRIQTKLLEENERLRQMYNDQHDKYQVIRTVIERRARSRSPKMDGTSDWFLTGHVGRGRDIWDALKEAGD